MQSEICNVDYNEFLKLLGTAHFTRRSLYDAYEAVKTLQPTDLAIELDIQRFRILSNACSMCSRCSTCPTKCEFIGATEALGNVDANIWLIDMSEQEIRNRIRRLPTPKWMCFARIPFINEGNGETQLWEEGFKDEVLNSFQERLWTLRSHEPAIWRVLIDERNTLMAVRLAWIATERLKKEEQPNILALVGAAHVAGIKELLRQPFSIRENLKRFSLTFTPPTLIRRIGVTAD